MGLGQGLALSPIVVARLTAERDVCQSGSDISRGLKCSACVRRTSNLLFHFFHFFHFVLGGAQAGLLRVSANGGVPTPILVPKSGEVDFLYPQIVPGGQATVLTVSPDRLT